VSTPLPRAVAEARITCPSYPWQAEGRLWDGPWFYCRIRSGRASLGLGASHEEAVSDGVWGDRIIDGVPWVPTDSEAWALFDRLLALRYRPLATFRPTASEDRDVLLPK
jgi:hypothetical protein